MLLCLAPSSNDVTHIVSLFSLTEGEDYIFDSVPPVVNILSGMSRGCLSIHIISSPLVEDAESIDLLINETTIMANVLEGRTTVVIEGDGSM